MNNSRVNLLSSEANDVSTSFKQCVRRIKTETARRELVANSYADLESGGEATALYEQERESLGRSGNMLNDYIGMMQDSLGRLQTQRDYIKGFRRKLLDMSNTFGLSRSVMRIASRRNTGDKVAVYGGMACTLLFMYLFWVWRTSSS